MTVAFIFDLDGIITDTAPLHYRAWKEMTTKIGIELDPIFNEHLKGLSRSDSLEKILVHYGQTSQFTAAEKQQLEQLKNERYQTMIQALTPNDILPGIVELLHTLRQNLYPIALASASHNAPNILDALQLREQFDAIADPSAVPFGKPAPDLFLLAAQLLQTDPAACIGIEDAASGVQAIKAAGMFAVGVGDRNILHNADMIVPSTQHLTLSNLLARYMGQ